MKKNYNFTEYCKDLRIESDLIKWSFAKDNASEIPMWVADMDFDTMPEIIEAIAKKAQSGLYGYTSMHSEYKESVLQWMKSRHSWEIEKDWIVNCLGVVFAYSQAIAGLCDTSGTVLIMTPAYNEFFEAIRASGRDLIECELCNNSGRYEIDFVDFESKIEENNVKIFLFCSPHNPVGRVWSEAELREISRICTKHGVFVISDEIHADLVFSGNKHIPYLMIDEGNGANSIICRAASKTFNLAGFQSSYFIAKNQEIRDKINREFRRIGYGDVSAFGTLATATAYRHGSEWLGQLMDTIEGNYKLAASRLKEECPKIKCTTSEGTYLLWLDCAELGLNDDEIYDFFCTDAMVRISRGSIYGGKAGKNIRMNIGCPESVVKKALDQIKVAYDKRGF